MVDLIIWDSDVDLDVNTAFLLLSSPITCKLACIFRTWEAF